MSLIYNADALKLLKENAKRHDNVELFKFDVHPRVHHLDDIVEKIYEELAALDAAIIGGSGGPTVGANNRIPYSNGGDFSYTNNFMYDGARFAVGTSGFFGNNIRAEINNTSSIYNISTAISNSYEGTSNSSTGLKVDSNSNKVGGTNYAIYTQGNGGTTSAWNYGIYSVADGGTTRAIAGYFAALNGGTNHALMLVDGSQSAGRFLKCINNDGRANWAGIAVSDVSGLVNGLWTETSGGNAYRNSNIGIGDFSSSEPAEALEVQGNIQVTGATAMFIGDIDGAVLQKVIVKEAGGVSKGDVVYISGGTGDNPEVMKARANSASTMAALGIMKETAAFDATAECITSGELTGINLTGFATGDDLYVSSSVAGELVNTAPTGEANLIQKIGKVIKGGNGGALTVLGAFRSNATPNLNQGSLFIGDASNQSSTLAIGGANTFLKSNGTTAAWSSISSSDLPTNLALVGTYNNGRVPRWNATTNTLESGTIRDDGTTISVGAAVNSERKVNIDNALNGNTDKYGLYINNTTASGTSGALYGQKIALSSTGGSNENYGLDIQLQANGGSPDELKALVINQFTGNTASGTVSFDIAGIEVGVGATAAGYTVNGDIRAIDILAVGTGATISGSTYGIYQQGASDINYFAGNVGIATDPLVELHVKGSQAIIRLESSDATGKNYLEFWDTSAIKGYVGYGSGTTNVFSIVNYEAGENVNMWTTDSGGTTRTGMVIDSDQNVSITNGNLSYNKQVYQTGGVYAAGNTGSSLTLDFNNGNIQECTMNAASITIANPTNAQDGSTVTICFIQDATASRTISTWGSNWNWGDAGAPDFSGGTAAGDKFYVTVIVNGTELDAIYSGVKH